MSLRLILMSIIFFINLIQVRSQDFTSTSKYTIKIGANVLASHGTDFWSLHGKTFYQPGINVGIQYKDMFYIGIYGSKYMFMKYEYANSFERDIIAGEFAIPINKFLLGITVGQDNYDAPSYGEQMARYEFKSPFLGVFVDYKLLKQLSIPFRLAYSKDPNSDGLGEYWHLSLGITGNISVQ